MTIDTPLSKKKHEDHHKYVETYRSGNTRPLGQAYLKAYKKFPLRFSALSLKETDGMDLFHKSVEILLINFSQANFILSCPFEAYLSSIFVNLTKEFWRKNAQPPVRIPEILNLLILNEPDTITLAEESKQRTRWYKLLNRTFALLGSRCQKILTLTAEKIAAADIAKQLNMTNANAVYQARVRCRNSWENSIIDDADYTACKPEKW